MVADDTVLLACEAGGTVDGELWRTPEAWMAVIRDGSFVESEAFADNNPDDEILGTSTIPKAAASEFEETAQFRVFAEFETRCFWKDPLALALCSPVEGWRKDGFTSD